MERPRNMGRAEKPGDRGRRRRRWVVAGVVAAVVVAVAIAVAVFLVGRDAAEWTVTSLWNATPSPDGSRIAFVAIHERPKPLVGRWTSRLRRGGFPNDWSLRLWILDRFSGRVERTMIKATYNTFPVIAWNPDSLSIALVSGNTETGRYMHLDRIDLPDFAVSPIDLTSQCMAPRYSPDGNLIGYVLATPVQELVTVNQENGERNVIARSVNPRSWGWTPDSGSVIYLDKDQRTIRRHTIADSADHVLYTPAPGVGYVSALVVLPDGRSIGFHESPFSKAGAFIHLDLATGQTRKLFESSGYLRQFAWRGTRIAYLDSGLRLFDLQTGASRLLARGAFREPQWLSDTEVLVEQDPTKLRVFDVDTGASTVLFSAGEP